MIIKFIGANIRDFQDVAIIDRSQNEKQREVGSEKNISLALQTTNKDDQTVPRGDAGSCNTAYKYLSHQYVPALTSVPVASDRRNSEASQLPVVVRPQHRMT